MAEFETKLENILRTERQDKRCIELIAEVKSNCKITYSEVKKGEKYGFVNGMYGDQITFGIGTLTNAYPHQSGNRRMNVRVLVDAHEPLYKITTAGIEEVTDSNENAIYEVEIICGIDELPLIDLEKTKGLREKCETLYEKMSNIRHGLKKQENSD